MGPEEIQTFDAATARPGGRTARVAEAVMQATLDELSEAGYAGLRIDAVADRAGVNKTTIYRRWQSKPNLVATALIARQAALVPVPDTGDLRTDALILLQEIRRALRTPWISALLGEIGPRRATGDDLHIVLDQLWAARFGESRSIFTRAIERGDLPAESEPDLLLEALCAPLYFRWIMLGRPLEDDFLEDTVDLVMAGAERAVAK